MEHARQHRRFQGRKKQNNQKETFRQTEFFATRFNTFAGKSQHKATLDNFTRICAKLIYL